MADKTRKKYRLSKIFKRAMALFIIVIINFNSYAAVVSSNDGSAFITKAEFDALVNDFNSRIEDYEKSIDAKIDGAIAEYLAGLASNITTELTNNLTKLQNNYDVFWSAEEVGPVTRRVDYGATYELQLGGRSTTYDPSAARQAQVSATVSGEFVNFPIISAGDSGYDIGYWEERKPFLNYNGFFIYNGDNPANFMSSAIFGIFSTNDFNPNTNNLFARQDQWWNIGYGANWAMSVWAIYTTYKNTRDNLSILIYPNAGNTEDEDDFCYCWNESETAKSTGVNDNIAVPNVTNKGKWSGVAGSSPTVYTGNINLRGYTYQSTANFPWCHKRYRYNELYDSRMTLVTGVRAQIKNGLALSEFKGPGKVTIYAEAERTAPIEIKVTKQDTGAEVKSLTGTVNTSETKFELDLKDREGTERFYIWLKYLPSTKSVIHVNSILFETEA